MNFNLEKEFLTTLEILNKEESVFSSDLIKSVIDLTLLDESASIDSLKLLQEKANINQVAAICVLPNHLTIFNHLNNIKRATVVNFPTGQESQAANLTLIQELSSTNLAQEIDYVFPYQIYLDGQHKAALRQYQDIYLCCQTYDLKIKVIIETGAFPNADSIYKVSSEILEIGCDFLKTSTGKIAIGATPLAAFSILKAIVDTKRQAGLKVSGGIKDPRQAYLYMSLASFLNKRKITPSWFRIGASSLLSKL
ncbi:deoxyribose-phosphate aldolase [Legionella sp. D16C41]|uniref:deoxyribose-phosphate aldolase n=1 Tax=Legionella sp. D16C41 TaxID=3402688 RepID=UPI003AF5697F